MEVEEEVVDGNNLSSLTDTQENVIGATTEDKTSMI